MKIAGACLLLVALSGRAAADTPEASARSLTVLGVGLGGVGSELSLDESIRVHPAFWVHVAVIGSWVLPLGDKSGSEVVGLVGMQARGGPDPAVCVAFGADLGASHGETTWAGDHPPDSLDAFDLAAHLALELGRGSARFQARIQPRWRQGVSTTLDFTIGLVIAR